MNTASDAYNRENAKTEKDHSDTFTFIQLIHPHGTGGKEVPVAVGVAKSLTTTDAGYQVPDFHGQLSFELIFK